MESLSSQYSLSSLSAVGQNQNLFRLQNTFAPFGHIRTFGCFTKFAKFLTQFCLFFFQLKKLQYFCTGLWLVGIAACNNIRSIIDMIKLIINN